MNNYTNLTKNIIGSVYIIVSLMILVGCTSTPTSSIEQKAPKINSVVTDLSIKKNDSIEIAMEYFDAYDINGDDMSVVLSDGKNYSHHGNVVIPDLDYVGDLYVGCKIVDDGGLASNLETIIISVLPDIEELMPLYIGATWKYKDTFFMGTRDSVDSSTFEITESYNSVIEDTLLGLDSSNQIFIGKWNKFIDNNGDTLKYLYTNTEKGLWSIGGISSTDTLIYPSLKLQLQAVKNDAWEYSPLRYNADSDEFFKDTTVEETKCTNEKLYVTVPAGIFQCTEYTYSFYYDSTNTSGLRMFNSRNYQISEEGITISNSKIRTKTNTAPYITVKLYYAKGVGYIQNLTYRDGMLIQQKQLTSYTVNEQQ